MATFTDVLDNITNTPGTPGNSYETAVDLILFGTSTFVNLPDVVDVNPTPTGKMRSRETYGSKGQRKNVKYADDYALTFRLEVVRDVAGKWQPAAADLMRAQQSIGAANRRTVRWYDLLGADWTSFQMEATVTVTHDGNGWDDAKFLNVTLESYGKAAPIINPTIAGVVPVVGGALPSARAVGGTIVISGDNFTGVTGAAGVKIGATNATSYEVLDDSTITAVMPAGAAGMTTITVTHPVNGAGAPIAYQRGA